MAQNSEQAKQYSLDRAYLARRATLIGSAADALLGATKIILGILSQSSALLADGIHSLSDLLTDLFVLILSTVGQRAPDDDHPYGHGRFETLGTAILSAMLIAIGAAIAYDSVHNMLSGTKQPELTPLIFAIVVASILSKEALFHYTKRVGEQLKSPLLIANAWHSRSDAISSGLVLLGLAGVAMGLTWLDAVTALVMAALVVHIGWRLGWDSLKELVDTALSEEERDGLRKTILSVPGVRGVHSLRTRKLGAHALLDVHIQVAPDITVSEGHHIGDTVASRLLQEHEDLDDVTFHIDAEDDQCQPCYLPLRDNVIAELSVLWEAFPDAKNYEQIHLHYLDRHVTVELFYPPDTLSIATLNALEKALQDLRGRLSWLGNSKIWQACRAPH